MGGSLTKYSTDYTSNGPGNSDIDIGATDPEYYVGGPAPAKLGGYYAKRLDDVKSKYAVGLVKQLGDASYGDYTWLEGYCGCSADGGTDCATGCFDTNTRIPQCCNPAEMYNKDHDGWWDINDRDKKGPCWSISGGMAVGARGPCFKSGTCDAMPTCTSCNTGLCPTVGTVKPSSSLIDFLYAFPGAAPGIPKQTVKYASAMITDTEGEVLKNIARFTTPIGFGIVTAVDSNGETAFIPGYSYVACPYDRAQIMSSKSNLEDFKRKFGLGTNSCDPLLQDDYYNMMSDLLMTRLQGVDCLYSGQNSSCSLAHVTGDELGAYVLDWFKTLPPACQNSLGAAYCAKYPTDGDCGCYNRVNDPEYLLVNNILSQDFSKNIPDGCWFKPCKLTSENFVHSDQNAINLECNYDVCQQVLSIIGNTGSVEIDNVKAILDCKKDNNSDGSDGSDSETADVAKKWMEKYWWIFLVAGGGILVLIVLIYIARRGASKN